MDRVNLHMKWVRAMEDVIISFRVPKGLRNLFQVAMKESNTNASEYLRDVMTRRVRGMIPVPDKIDPVDLARQILDGFPIWRTTIHRLAGKSDDENLADLFSLLAYTVIEQDCLLKQVTGLGEKISNERETLVEKFIQTKPTRKPYEPPVTAPPLPHYEV